MDDDEFYDGSDETTQDYFVAVDAAARRSHDDYPCDSGRCPFLDADGTKSSYFCRDNCGLGVG